jgi:hypothetical protein
MTSPSSTVRDTAKPPDRPGRVEARDPSRRYEQAVPLAPMDELTALVDRGPVMDAVGREWLFSRRRTHPTRWVP